MKIDKSTDTWHEFNVKRETIRGCFEWRVEKRKRRYAKAMLQSDISCPMLELTNLDAARAIRREYKAELAIWRAFYFGIEIE